MKRFIRVTQAILIVLLAVSLGAAAQSKRERTQGRQAYEDALAVARPEQGGQQASPSAPSRGPAQSGGGDDASANTSEDVSADASGPAAQAPAPPEPPPPTDLNALRAINPDVVGWIEIPGTSLSYPLLQGTDNQYYLNHTWNRKKNSMGAIYLECTSSPALDGFHTLIYGHRMNDGSMFGILKKYQDLDYWRAHPRVCITTEDGVFQYDIFSAREADVEGVVYRQDLSDSQELFVRDCLDSSVIDTGVIPEADGRFLTLSTCTGSGHDTRWVVHAVLAASS